MLDPRQPQGSQPRPTRFAWADPCPRCGDWDRTATRLVFSEASTMVVPGAPEWPYIRTEHGWLEAMLWTPAREAASPLAVTCAACGAAQGTLGQLLSDTHPDPSGWLRLVSGQIRAFVGPFATSGLELDADGGFLDLAWVSQEQISILQVRVLEAQGGPASEWENAFGRQTHRSTLATFFQGEFSTAPMVLQDEGLMDRLEVWGIDICATHTAVHA